MSRRLTEEEQQGQATLEVTKQHAAYATREDVLDACDVGLHFARELDTARGLLKEVRSTIAWPAAAKAIDTYFSERGLT